MDTPFLFLSLLSIFVLARCQEMPHAQLMAQLQACPKECECRPSFPNAVYCQNKGLKRVPIIPPFTWYLYLQSNDIETLPAESFRNASELRWVNLNRNKMTSEGIEEGALQGMPILVHLWVNLNRNRMTSEGIEEGALQGMPNLVHLYLEDNQLTSVPSPLPPKLEHLLLSKNRISKIPAGVFSGMDSLTLLDLQGNKLQDEAVTEMNLKGLTSLVQINLAKNQLGTMPLGLPPTMAQIYLDSNNIEKIPADYFKGMPKVTFLRLNNNKLGSDGIPKNVFNVSGMLDLQLSYNELTEVPTIPTSLEQLHLDHNKIKSVSGSEICPASVVFSDDDNSPRLRYLRLDGNEIQPPIPHDLMGCFKLLRAVVI